MTEQHNAVTVPGDSHRRIVEIDFIKAIMILLMIAFHIVFIGDTYPYAKKIVYTFHMPAFLIISGYMLNTGRSVRSYLLTLLWIFIPYTVMESGYTFMASLLPIREHVDNLTVGLLVEKILLHPLGPYWYLHTLMLCGLTCFFVFRLPRITLLPRLVILALCYAFLSRCLHVVSLPCAFYFMAGVVLRHSGTPFLSFFRPSLLSAVPFLLIACMPACLDKSTPGGIAMVYLAMSLCLVLFGYCRGAVLRLMLFIGRNTLVLLLFSPVFTVLAKIYQPVLLRVEPTGMLFLAVSLAFAVAGCFFIAAIMDRLGISKCFFGKRQNLK
ncbi:acyltransferase family protein [Xylanibacter caecicola]|uniref:acyltransferase family protein n=1 Tax=Xylanibacter caecicola TaxID=2736294 RepID=UPI002585AD0B|nr:acyltransferase family protein [Xylanibacter caecicola]